MDENHRQNHEANAALTGVHKNIAHWQRIWRLLLSQTFFQESIQQSPRRTTPLCLGPMRRTLAQYADILQATIS